MKKLNMKKILCSLIFTLLLFSCVSNAHDDMKLLNQVIDSKELNNYWHIDVFPNRSPLIVSVPSAYHVLDEPFEKFGKPVEVIKGSTEVKTAFFINEVIKKEEKIEMIFSYPPEGIKGTAVFNKVKDEWKIEKIMIFES